MVNSFDLDGVIYLGPGRTGVFPGPDDIIITGRSWEEALETDRMLSDRGINNEVYYNPLKYNQKTRETSGEHKARVITAKGVEIHFEDDEVQAEVIRKRCPNCTVVLLCHNLTNKENQRQEEFR